MQERMEKLIYIYPSKSSFIEQDLKILKKRFDVKEFFFNTTKKAFVPWFFLLQLLFLIRNVGKCRYIITHFAAYHSFLPAIFSRITNVKHYIFLHGTDCNLIPSIQYGNAGKPLLRWFTEKSMRWSDLLLPVSEALVSSNYNYSEAPAKQGFRNIYPKVKTPHKVVHNGVDTTIFKFRQKSVTGSPNSFITVAGDITGKRKRELKGVDLIAELAREMKSSQFTIVGTDNSKERIYPPNITFTGIVNNSDLPEIYSKHSFYLQLSIIEGFGIALCEAMLCGCIPIVSNTGILPLIAGESGYLLNKRSYEELKELVLMAVNQYDPIKGKMASKWIAANYNIDFREKKLIGLLTK